jgi:hypothetical protein
VSLASRIALTFSGWSGFSLPWLVRISGQYWQCIKESVFVLLGSGMYHRTRYMEMSPERLVVFLFSSGSLSREGKSWWWNCILDKSIPTLCHRSPRSLQRNRRRASHVSSASVTGDFAIEWRESSIPPGYLIACGLPVIATTGNR